MVMFSILHMYMIVTTLTAGVFCSTYRPGPEGCSNTFTVQDADGLAKKLETMIKENSKGRVVAVHTIIEGQAGDQRIATPTIEPPEITIANELTATTPTATTIATQPYTTTNDDEVTTSEPNGNDGLNQSDSTTTSDIKSSTTTSKDDFATSKPTDDGTCNTSHFIFPSKDHSDYVQYRGMVPEMKSFTACAWIQPAPDQEPVAGTLLSYCASTTISSSTECQTVHVKIDRTAIIKVQFWSGNQYTAIGTPIATQSHLCVVKTTSSTATYLNGSILPSTTNQNSDRIPGNGVLILGHSQNGPISGTSPGKQTFPDEGFHGEIEDFTIWARALNSTEIFGMYESDGCYCPSDAVVTFDRNNSLVSGHGVTYTWTDACDKYE